MIGRIWYAKPLWASPHPYVSNHSYERGTMMLTGKVSKNASTSRILMRGHANSDNGDTPLSSVENPQTSTGKHLLSKLFPSMIVS